MNRFFNLFRASPKSTPARRKSFRPSFEPLESREVLTATMVGGLHAGIASIQFSPDSKHLAFEAIDTGSKYVVEDGKMVGGLHKNVADILFSPDGNHLAFIAVDNGSQYVVEDGKMVGGLHT